MDRFRRTRVVSLKCCVALLLLGACCSVAEAFETGYWAWQRNEPPSAAELQELKSQGVRTIYWQIGELAESGAAWRWTVRFTLPASTPEMRYLPVVRLESRERAPFSAEANASLFAALGSALRNAEELQLDYDAPDRLLVDYAAMLKKLHNIVPRVTITALPHWSHTSAVRELRGAADEFLVMLYDFEPDQKGAPPLPLIVPEKMDRYLAEWNKTQLPWRAGLPVFARTTIFDAEGRSRGHVRSWSWDDICFNGALEIVAPTTLGVTSFRAKRDTRLENAAVGAGQLLTTRLPDREALSRAVSIARAGNAHGVVFFRFPDSTDPSGLSLRQVGHLESAPHLSVKVNSETSAIEVTNDSDADLTFTAEPEKRGYALQIEAPAAIFRDGTSGDFYRVASGIVTARPFASPPTR